MWNALENAGPPDFWPPRPRRFWTATLEPLRRYYLRRRYQITEVVVENLEDRFSRFGSGDSVLLAPNHSYDGDPHVMLEVARRVRRRFYFMAAWQLFAAHGGVDGWILQRLGAFSVDREGVDRRAIRQAVELLTRGQTLVVFPEGEIYRLNERLTPLLEGVAFMAQSAQRELLQTAPDAHVWIMPSAICYSYLDDIRSNLAAAMDRLETRFHWKPRSGATLPERILRFGEVLLTIKEKEKFGRSCEAEGDLPTRIRALMTTLLERLETQHLGSSPSAETTPLRIKAVRRSLLTTWTDENASPEARRQTQAALDDLHLVLQLYSYPGDYLLQDPTPERMAETIEKFEEDVEGVARSHGRRRARVIFGEAIDMKSRIGAGRARAVVAAVTDQLERSLQTLMTRRSSSCSPAPTEVV